MKKLMIVAAMLALTLVVAVPALAAPSNGLGNVFGFDNNRGNNFDNNFNHHRGNNFNHHRGNNFNNGGAIQAPTETFVSGSNANNAGSVQGGGANSNTCAAQENFNNSGGVLNQPSLQQRTSDIGTGVGFLGPAFSNAPAQSAPCEPTVQQAASSSSGS